MADEKLLWLEVFNVRRTTGTTATTGTAATTPSADEVEIQIKGDRSTPEPNWWPVQRDSLGKDGSETTKEIFRALDSKRLVLAGIGHDGTRLMAKMFRIQFADPGSR